MGKLTGRVAIITGGATGIGKAIAGEFAREGAAVVVSSRKVANLEKIVAEIKAAGGQALAVATDVTHREEAQRMAQQTVAAFGRVDILVNNAGTNSKNGILEMTEADWDTVLDTNLKSVFLCTQAVAQYMIPQRYGKVINMASMAGRGWNYIGSANYSTSKAGVIELTKCYARELAPYNINVNAIAPGLIDTEIFYIKRTPEQVQEYMKQHLVGSLIKRVGKPEEVAKLTLFLASDDASFITGSTYPIDGGRSDLMGGA
jgi:3-oxoacyl-[acyl-carrier protein] reductase